MGEYEFGKVSCVIPTFKRSDTLVRAVTSVLNQNYKNIEVIVVDDNNPNDEYSVETQRKLKNIKDSRLIYIQQKQHINGAVARNVGIQEATGEYIAFLDDDDEWNEEKIRKQISFLNNNPEIQGVSCLYDVKKDGMTIRKCHPYNGKNLHKKVIDRSVSVFTSTILLRRKALDKSGYFNETLLRHQDLQFLLDFLALNNMSVLNEYLVTLHADSEMNHPNVNNMIEIKKNFFKVCSNHLKCYNRKEQKQILDAHYFEIVVTAIRQREWGTGIKYIKKIGVNPKAYLNVINRWRKR